MRRSGVPYRLNEDHRAGVPVSFGAKAISVGSGSDSHASTSWWRPVTWAIRIWADFLTFSYSSVDWQSAVTRSEARSTRFVNDETCQTLVKILRHVSTYLCRISGI